MKIVALIAGLLLAGIPAMGVDVMDELKPIAYTNEVRTAKHERMIGWIYADNGDTNSVIGRKTESTNLPVAVVHSVTYGRGTNAVFVLKTCETLPTSHRHCSLFPPSSNEWQNTECVWYNDAVWIESPK